MSLFTKETSNNYTQNLQNKREIRLSQPNFCRKIIPNTQTLPKLIFNKQIPDYQLKKRQITFNSKEIIEKDNIFRENLSNPQTFKLQVRETKQSKDQQPKLRRILQTFSEVIQTETLRQYLIYLQECYKIKVAQQTQQNNLNKFQNKSQIVPMNFQLLQMIQISIKSHIKTIIKQRQDYANIKNIIQRDIIPKMQLQTQIYSRKSYSQILLGYLSKQLDNKRQMDIKHLRLRKKTITQIKTTKNKSFRSQCYQKNQTIQSLKRQNQLLEEKKRQMSQLIQILKAKNQQLTNQIHKYKGENSFFSNRIHPLNKKYKRFMQDQDQKSYQKIQFSERSISPILQKLYLSKGFKTPTKQFHVSTNQQQETKKKKLNQLIIANQKMTQKFQKKLEEKNNLINLLKNTIREKNEKITQIQDSKMITQKRIIQEQNSFSKSNKSISDVNTLEKIKKFKVQVGQLLVKSETKIKQQQKQLSKIHQIIKLSEKEIAKIMNLIKIERQPSNQNSQNQITINLKNIYDQLSSKIAVKQRQEKINYRNQLIQVIEKIKSQYQNTANYKLLKQVSLTIIKQIPNQQQNLNVFQHKK